MLSSNCPLVPKDPTGPLRVIMLGRISTPQQSLDNIQASYAADEKFLKQYYDGPVYIKHLGERGSGLRTDRVSIMEAEEEISTRTWDLVLMEDLSRAYRNPRHQYEFIQEAVDHETRVICIGDNLDTSDSNWEVTMMTATVRHGLHIPDTRRRVRRTAEHTFHQGGMVQKVRFGYRKLSKEEAATGRFGPIGLRIAKISDDGPIIHEICTRVLEGYEYRTIADWLNEKGILPGRYVKSQLWIGRTVVELLKDPLLQGLRTFREVIYMPIYKTGKYRREKNANPESKHYPELAHLTQQQQEKVWKVMEVRARRNGPKSGRANSRFGIPRNRGIWPSKHVRCAICGDLMERTLNDQLKCKNAFEKGVFRCWNHVQVKASVIRQKILPTLLMKLDESPGFRDTLRDAAWESYSKRLQRSQRKIADLDSQRTQCQKEQNNLIQAIRAGGEIPTLVAELKTLEVRLASIELDRTSAEQRSEQIGFANREAFAMHLEEGILTTAGDSFEFTDLMRDYVTQFVIVPVQALDSTQVHPRAKMTFQIPEGSNQAAVEISIVVDCFDPSEPIRILEHCREAQKLYPDWGCRRLAKVLNEKYMTVKRSLRYLKTMESLGTTDAFRELQERPVTVARWGKRKKENDAHRSPEIPHSGGEERD